LADDAILYQDGGGKRPAAKHPIRGKDNIIQFLTAVRKTKTTATLEHVERVHVNGLPGFLIHFVAIWPSRIPPAERGSVANSHI
jgi:RNA polymerase sigma-70 factor (ECF subfamily)